MTNTLKVWVICKMFTLKGHIKTFYIYLPEHNWNIYLTWYCHAYPSNKYAPEISYIFHMWKLFHEQVWGTYVNICTSCEVTIINSVTWSTSLYTFYIIGICPSNEYAPQMPHICHKPTLLKVHQWGKYANIYATCELTAINHVTGSTVYRQQQ